MTLLQKRQSRRFDIAPWLKNYEDLGQVLMPYVVKISTPNYRSAVVNTDRHGFRLSKDAVGVLDSLCWEKREHKGLLLGSSFAFGVGATQDSATLASCLNDITGKSFLNLAIRASNSTQEWIAAIPFLQSARFVVIVSGLNNLLVNVQSQGLHDLYGPLFGESILNAVASHDFSQLSVLLNRRFIWQRRRKTRADFLTRESDWKGGLARALSLFKRDIQFVVQ